MKASQGHGIGWADMSQIPVLNGIYTSETGDIRTSYPVNLVPVPQQSGISSGYLRPADGIVTYGTGPGPDRGGINWNGDCIRVMGNKLVKVSSAGALTILGTVAYGGQVSMDYSFDILAIASGGLFYHWNGSSLTTVTDPDLGTVIDFIWVDGYFMTTDGEFLVVNELNDPTSINPLKYGSSEADPDPILAIKKVRNEPAALNRYTIESFNNVGGEFFPFTRIEGAQIQKGVVGTHMCCVFLDAIAFVGGGRNEAISVYIGANGQAQKIATREIDLILADFTESELSACMVESRVENGHQFLCIHLPNQTLVYDAAASQALQQPVWHILSSAVIGLSQYRARNFVRCYDKWICGDPTGNEYGYLTDTISTHHGALTGWEFSTQIVYNESRGAVFHELELVALNGTTTGTPTIWTSYSVDGETFSAEKPKAVGSVGNRTKRIVWFQQGLMTNWRIQRFRGTSDAHISIARLEAQVEPLSV